MRYLEAQKLSLHGVAVWGNVHMKDVIWVQGYDHPLIWVTNGYRPLPPDHSSKEDDRWEPLQEKTWTLRLAQGINVAEYRKNEEFLKLQAQLGELQQREKELWAILLEKFPAPKGMTWCLMANHQLSVQANYGDE